MAAPAGPNAGGAAYARLFQANALALVSTGVATVALALLACDLAGDRAGAAMGTALALKMGANILVAPIAAAFAARLADRARPDARERAVLPAVRRCGMADLCADRAVSGRGAFGHLHRDGSRPAARRGRPRPRHRQGAHRP